MRRANPYPSGNFTADIVEQQHIIANMPKYVNNILWRAFQGNVTDNIKVKCAKTPDFTRKILATGTHFTCGLSAKQYFKQGTILIYHNVLDIHSVYTPNEYKSVTSSIYDYFDEDGLPREYIEEHLNNDISSEMLIYNTPQRFMFRCMPQVDNKVLKLTTDYFKQKREEYVVTLKKVEDNMSIICTNYNIIEDNAWQKELENIIKFISLREFAASLGIITSYSFGSTIENTFMIPLKLSYNEFCENAALSFISTLYNYKIQDNIPEIIRDNIPNKISITEKWCIDNPPNFGVETKESYYNRYKLLIPQEYKLSKNLLGRTCQRVLNIGDDVVKKDADAKVQRYWGYPN